MQIEHSTQIRAEHEMRISWDEAGHHHDHFVRKVKKKAEAAHSAIGHEHWLGLTDSQMEAVDAAEHILELEEQDEGPDLDEQTGPNINRHHRPPLAVRAR